MLYLFCPHMFCVSGSAAHYSECPHFPAQISPLSHFISVAEPVPREKTDMFFFKTDCSHTHLLVKLDEISAQYRIHGY